jgi:hypothetical protein
MLVQLVCCHPLEDSYNHALFQTIVAALDAGNAERVFRSRLGARNRL